MAMNASASNCLPHTGFAALDVAMSNKPGRNQKPDTRCRRNWCPGGVLLPFSRTHESEADRLGLILWPLPDMTAYMPLVSGTYVQQTVHPYRNFSTHPSDETASAISAMYMPEAMGILHRKIRWKGKSRIPPGNTGRVFYPVRLDQKNSSYSGEIRVDLVGGRCQLHTGNAIYSYEDRYTSFMHALGCCHL